MLVMRQTSLGVTLVLWRSWLEVGVHEDFHMTHTAPRAISLKRIEKRKHSHVKAGVDGA